MRCLDPFAAVLRVACSPKTSSLATKQAAHAEVVSFPRVAVVADVLIVVWETIGLDERIAMCVQIPFGCHSSRTSTGVCMLSKPARGTPEGSTGPLK
jgi:hypothetical protein